MIMNIKCKINNKNKKVSSASISTQINTPYSTARFVIDTPPPLRADVHLELSDETFGGFVYQVSKTAKNAWAVECRGNQARLTQPFSQAQDTIEPEKTATELLARYALEANIDIDYQSVDLDFGAGYHRKGTILDEVLKIAEITGSEIIPTQNGIKIVSLEEIGNGGLEIFSSDYFDFLRTVRGVQNGGIGTVEIYSESSTSTTQSCTFKIDDKGGIVIYALPFEGVKIESGAVGIEESESFEEENFTLFEQDTIHLKSEIARLVKISRNGIEIGAKSWEQNTIYLPKKMNGFVNVQYIGKVYRGKAHTTPTPKGAYYLIEGSHNGQKCHTQGFLEKKTNNCYGCDWVENQNGKILSICASSQKNYVKGFHVYILSDENIDPTFSYKVDGQEQRGLMSPTSEDTIYRVVDTPQLVPQEDGTWTATLSFLPNEIVEIYTSEKENPPYTRNGKILTFDSKYQNMQIAYNKSAKKYTFQHENIDGSVKLLVGAKPLKSWLEYDLEGFDKYDIQSYPCQLPQTLPVNIAEELSIPKSEVVGKVIKVKHKIIESNITVDNFGYVFVLVTEDGEYKIDTNNIKSGSYITLKVSTGSQNV